MDTDPERDDVEKRRDGPSDVDPRPPKLVKVQSEPHNATELQSPIIGLPERKSIQLPREQKDSAAMSQAERKSTQQSQQSRTRRLSRDFDIRRDGPYGRPSITMTRLQSSGTQSTPDISRREDIQDQVIDTQTSTEPEHPDPPGAAFEPKPPPLNYTLWTRKWSIVIFWSLILLDCIAMPIALYFGLWYGTNLSPNIVFSIVTAALGGVSIVEYILRFVRLWKKNSTCRVIGARRMYLDWFHWNFSFGWMIIMIELIVGTIPKNPPIRLLSMPVTSMLYVFGTELLVVDLLRYFKIPAPVRISSIPKGAQLRPGIYSVIEDVCAVDGSGGTAFREALNKRYEASHVFRAMLRRLGAFWAFGAETTAVVMTILIFTIQHEAAYVIGWTLPFIWAGVWIWITIWYVRKKLKEEEKGWTQEIVEKATA